VSLNVANYHFHQDTSESLGNPCGVNRSTRILAAAPLQAAFARARFEPSDVEVAKGRETIILRADDGKATSIA
jgi:hypothetical protein